MGKIAQSQQPEFKPAPVETHRKVYRKRNGAIQMLSIQVDTANKLIAAQNTGNLEPLNRYFDAAFSKKELPKEAVEQEKVERDAKLTTFISIFNKTNCLHCMDGGLHRIEGVETPLGVYTFHTCCTCDAGMMYARSCEQPHSGILQGLVTMHCQLGGESGEFCLFDAKRDKCKRHNCPKFRG